MAKSNNVGRDIARTTAGGVQSLWKRGAWGKAAVVAGGLGLGVAAVNIGDEPPTDRPSTVQTDTIGATSTPAEEAEPAQSTSTTMAEATATERPPTRTARPSRTPAPTRTAALPTSTAEPATSTPPPPTAVPATAIPATEVPQSPTNVPPPPAPEVQSDCVDINTASLEEMRRIMHLDEVRGPAAIQLRPYRSVADLSRIKGIGAKRLADIQAQGLACVR